MKSKKPLLAVVALAVVLVGTVLVVRYAAGARDRAEREASVQLKTFYKLVGKGYPDAAACRKLAVLLDEMAATAERCGDDMQQALFDRRMDGAFIIGDYAKAEAMMDEMKDRTPGWKEAAKAKIRAHAALAKNDKAKALAEFTDFCAKLAAEKEDNPEVDPYTGIEWPREWVLAHNYKRMSGLAKDIGKAELAAKLLKDAAAAYRAAYGKVQYDAASKAELEKDAGDLLK